MKPLRIFMKFWKHLRKWALTCSDYSLYQSPLGEALSNITWQALHKAPTFCFGVIQLIVKLFACIWACGSFFIDTWEGNYDLGAFQPPFIFGSRLPANAVTRDRAVLGIMKMVSAYTKRLPDSLNRTYRNQVYYTYVMVITNALRHHWRMFIKVGEKL